MCEPTHSGPPGLVVTSGCLTASPAKADCTYMCLGAAWTGYLYWRSSDPAYQTLVLDFLIFKIFLLAVKYQIKCCLAFSYNINTGNLCYSLETKAANLAQLSGLGEYCTLRAIFPGKKLIIYYATHQLILGTVDGQNWTEANKEPYNDGTLFIWFLNHSYIMYHTLKFHITALLFTMPH